MMWLLTTALGAYEPTWASLDARPNPAWYAAARFGIKIHWGPYAVPSWGPYDPHYDHSGVCNVTVTGGSCYAEQYERFYRDPTHPTSKFHAKAYGNASYQDLFFPAFRPELYDPDAWAGIFADAGAQYVYMTWKHSDGFALGPTERRPGRNSVDVAGRDLYGDLAAAVRARGLRMGIFYEMEDYAGRCQEPASGCGFGCSFYQYACPRERAYVQDFLVPELYDLAERYLPDLYYVDGDWSGSSDDLETKPFLAWLFNNYSKRDIVVVNDRWGNETRTKHGGYFLCEYDPKCRFNKDFAVTMGFGASFGFSRPEEAHPEILLNGSSLCALLVRTAAKSGNLELNVGPTGDGRIPASMQIALRSLGAWLRANGASIYGTRGWPGPGECERDGPVERCYTLRDRPDGTLDAFVHYLGWPPEPWLAVPRVAFGPRPRAELLATGAALAVSHGRVERPARQDLPGAVVIKLEAVTLAGSTVV